MTGKKHYSRFYLGLLAVVALLITVQSVVSFLHEREALKLVSRENIKSEGERLAEEIEVRTKKHAEECLAEGDLQVLAARLGDRNNLQDNIEFGLKAREVSQKHPIAGSFFLLVDGHLQYPRLKAGKPYSPLDAVSSGSPSEEKDFAALFRKAERESERGRYESAIEILEKCSMMPVSDELKSRSLDLLARVYLADRNPTNAVRIWNRLEDKFPDCLNEYHVPYTLVAAIEIDQLDAGKNTDRRKSLANLYRDLLNGRWLLSEEVVLDLKDRLEKRLTYLTPETEPSSYLDQFKVARLVEEELKKKNTAGDLQKINARVIHQEADSIQLFYTELREKGPHPILAMSVNQKWVRDGLLDECRKRLRSSFKAVSDFIILPKTDPGATDLSIPFNDVFPFLELRLPKGAIADSQFGSKAYLAVIGLTAVTTLVLLVFIMFLIVRITRERMAIKIKSEFLSHVSHELKTPLTLIQLYTETLLTDETLDEADRRYSLQVISRESTNLLNLIENLLHLSGTEQAMEQFNLTEGDLGPVIEKTAGVYAEWLRNQRMELKVSIAQALPLVRFDREKVTRAFLNLLDNAKKYGGDAELIEVGLWSENHKVILEVRDHGPGISEPERKMIFDQFYRGANASESRGVGLGLFLVNETMKAHNGSVDLKTEPGKGSAFRLVFPVSGEDTEGHPGSDV